MMRSQTASLHFFMGMPNWGWLHMHIGEENDNNTSIHKVRHRIVEPTWGVGNQKHREEMSQRSLLWVIRGIPERKLYSIDPLFVGGFVELPEHRCACTQFVVY